MSGGLISACSTFWQKAAQGRKTSKAMLKAKTKDLAAGLGCLM
jgi:hypothetical protein